MLPAARVITGVIWIERIPWIAGTNSPTLARRLSRQPRTKVRSITAGSTATSACGVAGAM
jgi:hypothetical protein